MDSFQQDLRYAVRTPGRRPGFTCVDAPPPEPGREPTALLRLADRNGLDVLSISIRTGRSFEATDRHGTLPVALVNEAAARRLWPGEDPAGTIDTNWPRRNARTRGST